MGWKARRASLVQRFCRACACHPTWALAIVSGMFSRLALLRSSLALILTVSFFWIPVACMTICTESGAEQGPYATSLPDSFSASHDRDCCPIADALPSVLPEHRVTTLPRDNHLQVGQISTVRLVGLSLLERGLVAIPVSNSDPPLERLCALRI